MNGEQQPESARDAFATGRYRTGNKNPRNIYLVVPGSGDAQEIHVACVFDPADGPYFANTLNRGLQAMRAEQEEN